MVNSHYFRCSLFSKLHFKHIRKSIRFCFEVFFSSDSSSSCSFYSVSQAMFKTKIANGSQVAFSIIVSRQKLKFVSVFSIAFNSPEQKKKNQNGNGNLSKCETNHVMKNSFFVFFPSISLAFLLFSAFHVSQTNQV